MPAHAGLLPAKPQYYVLVDRSARIPASAFGASERAVRPPWAKRRAR